jgi:hypothetical protein
MPGPAPALHALGFALETESSPYANKNVTPTKKKKSPQVAACAVRSSEWIFEVKLGTVDGLVSG